MKNIIDKTIESGDFTIFINALQEAGLTDIFCSEGPYTVFVPNDDAFNKLPKNVLKNILKDKERLTEIITYHVLAIKIKSDKVKKMNNVITVQGSKLEFNGKKYIKVNNAKIIKKDIECKNGIIHEIDKVLIPEKLIYDKKFIK